MLSKFSTKIMRRIYLSRSSVSISSRNGSSFVKSETRGNVGIITLCDPARLNALTAAMGEQFVAAVDEMNVVCKRV